MHQTETKLEVQKNIGKYLQCLVYQDQYVLTYSV
jgi:hypothetical protein